MYQNELEVDGLDNYGREVREVMQDSVDALAEKVVGHKIVNVTTAEHVSGGIYSNDRELTIELDNGRKVILRDGGDCCAYTFVKSFLLNVGKIDHIITGVGTTDNYEKWHIYADMGDVLELDVAWSEGNYPYYGYGFWIEVEDADN